MSAVVPLNRRFQPSRDEPPAELDILFEEYTRRDALTWRDLLSKRRVVILAEAGSGKSTELDEQARLSRAAGHYTFSATVQNVGRLGLDQAVRADGVTLAEWRTSAEPAWFFLDSIDEAKDRNVPLQEALTNIRQGIAGCEARAHIVLSGRHGDWEFRRDLARLSQILPVPPSDRALAPLEGNQRLVQIIRREKTAPPTPAEAPLVVFMAGLDRDQVATFARANAVVDGDAFLEAIGRADLWRFARRPIDLGWLVDYWKDHGHFGSYEDMLEGSLRYRLREPDPQRGRSDSLSVERAFEALERIGAALTLQKLDYLRVPDTTVVMPESRTGLDLGELMVDWSDQDQLRLINRAVFDPVVAGLVGLHHDNEREVRSYLAARWFKRLLDRNCPAQTVIDLLFATTYDFPIVIPSMRQTAAWLSLWNPAIANEAIRRDPALLMAHGDPARLPVEIREHVLRAVVQRLYDRDNVDPPGHDNLKRFARADLSPAIRAIWHAHADRPAVRELLLRMIWLGAIHDCADLAASACFGMHTDRSTQLLAGRALMAVAPTPERQRYIAYLKANATTVNAALVSDAVDALFPQILSVEELLQFLANLDLRHGAHRLDHLLPQLPGRLTDIGELQRLVTGLLASVDESADQDPHDALVLTIVEASRRLLEMSLPATVIEIAIDGLLLAVEGRRRRRDADERLQLLFASPERRRATLYRAAAKFADTPGLHGEGITAVWQLQVVNLSIPFELADMPWLLEDARARPTAPERRLAADAWMRLARNQGLDDDAFAPIRAIAASHPEVAAVLNEWTATASSEVRDSTRTLQRVEHRNALAQAKQEKSWAAFADSLRRDPQQLRSIAPPANNQVDRRLTALYELLDAIGQNRSRISIDSVEALAPMFDDIVRAEIRDAFIGFWRHWSPKIRSERPPRRRQLTSNFDHIGLIGLALEAAADPRWATRLTPQEAALATRYAVLELNGFPPWLATVARTHPQPVREILWREIECEFAETEGAALADVLDKVQRAGADVRDLVADALFDYLRAQMKFPPRALHSLLRILALSLPNSPDFVKLLVGRTQAITTRSELMHYVEHLFRLAPDTADQMLEAKLATMDGESQTLLVQAVLPRLVADDVHDQSDALAAMSLATLDRLVRLAYRTVRVDEDNDHRDGETYTPDARDDAESARSAVFKRLIDTPGRATIRTIQGLMKVRDFPISRKQLVGLILQRAAEDSEFAAWRSEDVRRFQNDHATVPRTPHDLQRLALRRLLNLQHDLLHADFAQGATLAGLPDEAAVQGWLAAQLEQTQGHSYSVERESVVVEKKAPDIRFRSRASTASVPMEIKVADSWTFAALQSALTGQLVKHYLRDRENRYGILLLVHQRPRSQGWRTAKGKFISIHEVLARLQKHAAVIAGAEPLAPQPIVALLDVSSAYRATRTVPTKGQRKSAKKLARKKTAKRLKVQPRRR